MTYDSICKVNFPLSYILSHKHFREVSNQLVTLHWLLLLHCSDVVVNAIMFEFVKNRKTYVETCIAEKIMKLIIIILIKQQLINFTINA